MGSNLEFYLLLLSRTPSSLHALGSHWIEGLRSGRETELMGTGDSLLKSPAICIFYILLLSLPTPASPKLLAGIKRTVESPFLNWPLYLEMHAEEMLRETLGRRDQQLRCAPSSRKLKREERSACQENSVRCIITYMVCMWLMSYRDCPVYFAEF